MRILFITRKYPPSLGGMQKFNYQLYTHLARMTESKLVSWDKSQKWLPIAYPYLLMQGLLKATIFKPDIIYIGDAMMSLAGLSLKTITGRRIVCMAYGLDITFPFPGYQRLIVFCLSRLDKVICISGATQKELIEKGLLKKKTVIVPGGIDPKEISCSGVNKDFVEKLKVDLANSKILLTVGRLVKRKGHEWFVKNVMSKLPKNVIYLVAGDGPEKEKIQEVIKAKGLEDQVFLLGWVTDDFKNFLYHKADLFVMPNIRVKGDMEGFGLVILEAGTRGLFTVASGIEGITDVVKNKVNGLILPSSAANDWIMTINTLLTKQSRVPSKVSIKRYCLDNYGWEKISKKYLRVFKEACNAQT